MHLFPLEIPRLDCAAMIPNGDHVTVCLLGESIDAATIGAFFENAAVRSCLPPDTRPEAGKCSAVPGINVREASRPFADRARIVGTLTTVDRLIVLGHLRSFWHRGGFSSFLLRPGVYIFKDFGRYVHAASERMRLHASEIARKPGRPFVYQDRVVRGKDELAREIAKRDKIAEGLTCVLSTLEVATCFALVGGANHATAAEADRRQRTGVARQAAHEEGHPATSATRTPSSTSTTCARP